ncbi:aspartate carbamoyltransferase catalytic subunit [Roseivivax sediminis]|uniref:Aspartate carbamoyltransferase catalytic subunit n=1 Tax=Roseivivax sediminis TaxID=936889 RepID=A0A1I1W7N5_9RHOB|nr:aspartate carbamoyltransferase catalytic subunit [Roseivivax sediminis]SFD91185.1 hypothetical protein SAMN04515678_104173 [Roseivivax sediminis]
MSDLEVRAAETGIVRVFHLDLPADAVERFTGEAGTGEWPVKYALGATALRRDFVEIVAIRDLGAMTLPGYLEEAYDIAGKDLEADRAELEALTGHVLVLPSQAFERTAQTLDVRPPLRFVGAYREPGASAPAAPLHSAASGGAGTGGSAPNTAPGRRSPLLQAMAYVIMALFAAVVVYLLVAAL